MPEPATLNGEVTGYGAIMAELAVIRAMLERLMPLLDAIESNPMVKGMLG